jgi:DNA/RNA-binding domain of Phe-tRNA-synthetase-like protein
MITVAPGLAGVIRPGVLAFEGLRAAERDERLDAVLTAAETAVRVHPPAEGAAVRAMYRRVGLDPTKRRPSSEALLRRVVRGEPLPRVNTLVDVCNWCSLELQLPYGLYDLDRIEPPLVLRLGEAGEHYAGIRKDVVNVSERLTLADARGAFGNPSSDSSRTMVTTATTRALAVIFAPAELERASLDRALEITSARILAAAGGRETSRVIV